MKFRVSLLSLLLCAVEVVAAPPSLPAAAAPCAECHGIDGVALKPATPHLNGQIESYLVDSLVALKEGSRPTTVSAHNNAALTEKEIAATAKAYAAQNAVQRPVQFVDPARVALGAEIYKQRCAKCHLDDGRDSDHDAPLMAGQALDYLQAQTEAYVSGKRKFPFLMDDAYRGLKQEDLVNASHYFAAAKAQ